MDALTVTAFALASLSLVCAWFVAPRRRGVALVGMASGFAGYGEGCALIHQFAASGAFLAMVPLFLYLGIRKYGALVR